MATPVMRGMDTRSIAARIGLDKATHLAMLRDTLAAREREANRGK